MTASKTPNLGLMNPVGADSFQTSDFADTFQKLDQVPGILTVANQAGRPTSWTASQHGRRVWQADQNIEWVWHQPSSGTAGIWKRTFARGLLAQVVVGTTISTSNTNYSTGATLASLNNVVIPGGRPYKIVVRAEWVANDANMSIISTFENNGMLAWVHFGGSHFDGGRGMPGPAYFEFSRPAPSVQTTMNFRTTLNSHNGFGGTTICWAPSLEIVEY